MLVLFNKEDRVGESVIVSDEGENLRFLLSASYSIFTHSLND